MMVKAMITDLSVTEIYPSFAVVIRYTSDVPQGVWWPCGANSNRACQAICKLLLNPSTYCRLTITVALRKVYNIIMCTGELKVLLAA